MSNFFSEIAQTHQMKKVIIRNNIFRTHFLPFYVSYDFLSKRSNLINFILIKKTCTHNHS